MTTKQRYPLAEAHKTAVTLSNILLAENCVEKVEVAGSIRRQKQEVGDIELLCVPKLQYSFDMFGEADEKNVVDMLDLALQRMIEAGILEKRGGYGAKNKMLRHVESGIPIDVFSTTAENWGMSLVVRTGSAAFVRDQVMAALKRKGHEGHAYGGITLNAYTPERAEINCPTESDVFKALGRSWIEPRLRE